MFNLKKLLFFTCICPWLMFNSCSDGLMLTQQCQEHWDYLQSVNSTELWAMKIFDANGKKEAGVLGGNTVFEGDYHQCTSVHPNATDPKTSGGLFCMAYWLKENVSRYEHRAPGNLLGAGFCVPHTCTDKDASAIFPLVNPHDEQPLFTYTKCARDKDVTTVVSSIVAIILLTLFASPVIVATVYDSYLQRKKKQSRGEKTSVELTNGRDMAEKQGNSGGHGDAAATQDKNHQEADNEQDHLNSAGDEGSEAVKPAGDVEQVTVVTPQPLNQNHQQSKCSSLLLCSSLYTNIPLMLSVSHAPGSYTCLSGLRFFSMAWIVLGHCYSFLHDRKSPVVSNVAMLVGWDSNIGYKGIRQMWLGVETFFIMSGMLVTISFLKWLNKNGGKVTLKYMVWFYLHRYFRLTPVYMMVLMFFATIFLYIGSGPFFDTTIYNDPLSCRYNFWKNALYIQNLFPVGLYSPCMGWAWYLSCDFQFYCISPFFIILLFKFPRAGVAVLIVAAIFFVVVTLCQITFVPLAHTWFVDWYIRPWVRINTYLMGMLLGYVIYKTKGKAKLSKVLVYTCWVISFVIFPVIIYAPSAHYTLDSVLHASFNLIIMWIVYACINGYGGFVNTILCWSVLVPLARLTYVGYLIHPIILWFVYNTLPVQLYVTHTLIIFIFLGVLTMTMGLSFFISLLFEVPFLRLDKVIYPRKK